MCGIYLYIYIHTVYNLYIYIFIWDSICQGEWKWVNHSQKWLVNLWTIYMWYKVNLINGKYNMDLLSVVVYQSGEYVAKTLVVRRTVTLLLAILFVGLKSICIHIQP